MSKTEQPSAREQVVGLMRANLEKIESDVFGFLRSQCDDLLAAGINPAALAQNLTKLGLFYGTQVTGAKAQAALLRRTADAIDESIARTDANDSRQVRY